MTSEMVRKKPKAFPDYVVPKLLDKLVHFDLSPWKGMLEEEKAALEAVCSMLKRGLEADNYKRFLSFLIYAEEAQVRTRYIHSTQGANKIDFG